MKLKEKETHGESKKFSISILLYVVAAIVALLGIGLLADNLYLFKSTVDQYVMQGYPANDVMKSLIPAQLLPGVFEAIALYGGMTFALIGIGIANKKISKFVSPLNTVEEEAAEIEDEAEELEQIETMTEEETIEVQEKEAERI